MILRALLAAVLLVAVLLVAGCTPTFTTETDDEIRIHFGGGGLRAAKMKTYAGFYATGKQVVIDGPVASMDAFLAVSIPGACYTENASLLLHAASYLGLWPARQATRELMFYLPKAIRERFRRDFAYYDFIGFMTIGYDELLELWPAGACDQDDVRAAAD